MITERTLRNWRRQALQDLESISHKSMPTTDPESTNVDVLYGQTLNKRIVRLTGDLLDQHLLRKV